MKLFKTYGYEVFAAGNGDEDKEILTNIGIQCFDITFDRSPFSINNLHAINQLNKLFKENKFDLVHVHTPIAAFLVRYVLRNNKNIKVIYTAHGFHFYKGAPLINHIIFKPLEYIASKWTDHLITINNEDYNNALSFPLEKSRISLINGVGVEQISVPNSEIIALKKELNIKEGDFVISYVAELNKNKNHIFLLKNWKTILENCPHAKLLIIGTGNLEKELKNYVKYNHLKRIEFLGYRRDVQKILKITDLVTLLSYREGLPKSIMEALVLGIPCIVTNTRGSRDLIKDNINGYIIDIDDDVNLVDKFIKIINSPKLYSNMSMHAKQIGQLYLIENVIKEYQAIYNKVLEEEK